MIFLARNFFLSKIFKFWNFLAADHWKNQFFSFFGGHFQHRMLKFCMHPSFMTTLQYIMPHPLWPLSRGVALGGLPLFLGKKSFFCYFFNLQTWNFAGSPHLQPYFDFQCQPTSAPTPKGMSFWGEGAILMGEISFLFLLVNFLGEIPH